MTITYDITTDIGIIRLLIGDNDIVPPTDAHFTDEELQVFLTLTGDVYLAAAMALQAWAATLSASATSERIGDYSYTKKTVDNMLALAAQLTIASTSGPVMDWAEPDLCIDLYGEEI